jgi:thioredoxin-dependent peroxiredoxin
MTKKIYEGMKAPAFSAPSTDGTLVTLDSLRGKNIVLYFYPKDETSGCTKEACSFRDSHSEFDALNTVVFGVSKDSVEKHRKFTAKHGLNFPLLADPEGTLIDAFGAWNGLPSILGKTFIDIKRMTVLIDAEGIIRHIWWKVDVAFHAYDVLETVRKLAAAAPKA